MSYYILHKIGGGPKLIKADGADAMNKRLATGNYRVEGFSSKEARDEFFSFQMTEIKEEAEFERSLT